MSMLLSPFTYALIYVVMWYLRLQEYPDSPIGFPILPVLQAIVVVLWLVRTPRRIEVPQIVLLPLLLVSMFISTITNGWFGGVVQVFVLFVPTILCFLIIVGTADSLRRLDLLAWAITLSVSVIAVHGILQADAGIGWSGARLVEKRITYLGVLSDPNDLGVALLMALPLQVYLLTTTRRLMLRLLLLVCIAAVMWSIYLTNSRGAVLGLLALVITFTFRTYGLTRTLIVAPLLAAALIAGAPSRVDDMSADEESAAGRVDAWYEGFDMFRQRPLFGVGVGNFTDHNRLTAHNSFVLAMAELGSVGYYLWLSLMAISALMVWRIVAFTWPEGQAPPDDEAIDWLAHQRFAAALLYAMIAYVVTAFFLSRSYLPILYMTYGLCAAVYLIVRNRWPLVPVVAFGSLWGRLLMLEIASLVALRGLIRVLL